MKFVLLCLLCQARQGFKLGGAPVRQLRSLPLKDIISDIIFDEKVPVNVRKLIFEQQRALEQAKAEAETRVVQAQAETRVARKQAEERVVQVQARDTQVQVEARVVQAQASIVRSTC